MLSQLSSQIRNSVTCIVGVLIVTALVMLAWSINYAPTIQEKTEVRTHIGTSECWAVVSPIIGQVPIIKPIRPVRFEFRVDEFDNEHEIWRTLSYESGETCEVVTELLWSYFEEAGYIENPDRGFLYQACYMDDGPISTVEVVCSEKDGVVLVEISEIVFNAEAIGGVGRFVEKSK